MGGAGKQFIVIEVDEEGGQVSWLTTEGMTAGTIQVACETVARNVRVEREEVFSND
jgi:hypothetical protein